MPTGRGYWLDPRDGALHEVSTHNDWLLVPENQQKVGLREEHVSALETLDPIREIDEFRMIGLKAGLIRIRDYYKRVSVQFFADTDEVAAILGSVVDAVPKATRDKYPVLAIQNLRDDSAAVIGLQDLEEKLNCGEKVMATLKETTDTAYNDQLRQRVNALLADKTSESTELWTTG